MSRAIGEILRRYRRLFLVLFDVIAVAAAYMGTWMLTLQGSDLLGEGMTGMADSVILVDPYKKYFSLMVSSCFFFVSCYVILYAFM